MSIPSPTSVGTSAAPGAVPAGAATGPAPLRRRAADLALGRLPADPLDRFHAAADPISALRAWFGDDLARLGARSVADALDRDIAMLDTMLTDQLNAILHHPRFRALEASWRGLDYLCRCGASAPAVTIKALNVSWTDLAHDFERAEDVERSALFEKIYNAEFGMPGGQPYGVLLCDYEIRHRPLPSHPTDDISVLASLAGVAAAAFAPAVLGASPHLLGLDDFADLDRLHGLAQLFRGDEYHRYERLRQQEDTRFLALVLPRILMRAPYTDVPMPFRYREDRRGLGRDELCWGNAVYAFGEVLIRAFDQHGWFADICGARPDEIDHGLVTGVPAPSTEPDAPEVVQRLGCEIVIPAPVEADLWQLGLMNLNACKDTPYLIFRSGVSIGAVPQGAPTPAVVNARVSAMLRYMLCVSRFAHYVKVQVRDRVGSYATPEACEAALQLWLHAYSIGNDDAAPEVKARYPLREARVEVREIPGRPGAYACIMQLRPHFQLDRISTTFKLVTDLSLTGRAPAQVPTFGSRS